MYELTKSKYCKGLQCPKILWLDEYHPEFGENIAKATPHNLHLQTKPPSKMLSG